MILSAETSLYYLNSRYYDPEVGRFISPDSADYLDPENINGLNVYNYCYNNPVMYTDPYGTTAWWEWLIAGIVTVIAVVGAGVLTVTTGGLAAAVVTGVALGAVASLTVQAGLGELNWKQFAVDILVGAISGAFSYGIGQIARYGGQLFASWLGNTAISGIRINKVISQSIRTPLKYIIALLCVFIVLLIVCCGILMWSLVPEVNDIDLQIGMTFIICISAIMIIIAVVLYFRNCIIKRNVEKWLTDDEIIERRVIPFKFSEAGNVLARPMKIGIRFLYNNRHLLIISRKYSIVFKKLIGREIMILYTPKYNEVMILK